MKVENLIAKRLKNCLGNEDMAITQCANFWFIYNAPIESSEINTKSVSEVTSWKVYRKNKIINLIIFVSTW